MYGEALAYALSKNRPSAEVVRVEPGDLDAQLEGFGPRLVVCNEATEQVKSLVPSWAVLTYPRAVEADVCLGGRRSTIEDVRVEDVLAVMDEAERLSAGAT
jgi:hypothetical protein